MDTIDEQPPENPMDIILDELGEIKEKMDGLATKVGNLEEQTKINCGKLDIIDKRTELLPKMYEMVEANGNNVEEIAKALRDKGLY